ncbi:Uncharacterized protein family UPF0102 [Thermovirga lienii DSM 17291]|jgi:putative endonuclease|uniref:UPF0102 protein Tlie_0527 n=1 Tax=Thermovirga lienii (strain ATCC BAA-1197 / DSM 17291 / Cas60314) TaxID=580340 RepID=G7V826_THELD|nr:YraN family protein [Thermovirga lienii]AER66262.1 Uncharacterized protein family UPF0102 [Thermovirga lienii DSM 17291]KUK42638.1 MAG: hypothetical protein XD70_0544 [Thermovirga lienii]MDN5319185.1 putative endonuclease [Thermovirga sp.]MDN5368476.1 putative endonuclease [Thermovirga sp.]
MSSHLKLGSKGEDFACRKLEELGYEIVSRNVRFKLGEIDVVAMESGELVFVEVRTRSVGIMSPPEATVGPRKLKKLVRCGQAYVEKSGWSGPWRIDIAAVTVDKGNSMKFELFKDVTVGLVEI